MAIAAHFETYAQGTARSSRRTLLLEADGALPSGEATRVLVHNVSHTGLLIDHPADHGDVLAQLAVEQAAIDMAEHI